MPAMTILTHPSNDKCKFAPRNEILSYEIPAPVPSKAKESSSLLALTILTHPGNDKCNFLYRKGVRIG